MTVLHLDPGLPGMHPVEVAPAPYVASTGGEYVHLPRSARRWTDYRQGARESVTAWCGVGLHTVGVDGRRAAEWLAEVPEGRPLCGTCVGRDSGYRDNETVAFRPTKSLAAIGRRRWCPGPARGLWVEHGRGGVCVLCGHADRQWGRSMRNHAPEVRDALLFCPSCGWEHLHLAPPASPGGAAVVTCSRWQCTYTATVTVEVPPAIVTVERRPDLEARR